MAFFGGAAIDPARRNSQHPDHTTAQFSAVTSWSAFHRRTVILGSSPIDLLLRQRQVIAIAAFSHLT